MLFRLQFDHTGAPLGVEVHFESLAHQFLTGVCLSVDAVGGGRIEAAERKSLPGRTRQPVSHNHGLFAICGYVLDGHPSAGVVMRRRRG